MQRGLIVDVAVAAIVLYSIVRGWMRRTLKVGASLAALVAGLLLAPFFVGITASLAEGAIGLDVNTRRALSLAVLLIAFDVVVAVIVHRKTRGMRLPGSVLMDRFAGATLGAVRGILVAALLVFGMLAVSASAADLPGFAQGVDESSSGDVLTGEGAPVALVLDTMLSRTDEMRALSLWVRQQTELRITVPEDRLTFEGSGDIRSAEAAERELLELLNEARSDAGVTEVDWCESCAKVARAHVRDMYRNGYFSHVDLDGRDPFERLRARGISYEAAGENLAIAPTAVVAHEGLMRSPIHRENLLRPLFDEVGIGVFDGPYGLIAAQLFRDSPD